MSKVVHRIDAPRITGPIVRLFFNAVNNRIPHSDIGRRHVNFGSQDMGAIVKAKGMVEKPKAGEAPSNLAVIGRYILSPKVLTNLNKMKQGAGGEIQLTDAIAEETKAGNVYGYRFRGQRYDCGSKAGFLQATVAFGLARPDLRDEFSAYLNDMRALQKAAQ